MTAAAIPVASQLGPDPEPYGDRFDIYSVVFRTIAGLFFSALYLLRGFGITAWTHALYDVFLLLR